MLSGKSIDVTKSSLVSLKAELLRKQEEAQKTKGKQAFFRPTPKPKKEAVKNPGVEERCEKDQELSQEECDALQKSREVLEIKSKLYDQLQKGQLVSESGETSYLVDFEEKIKSGSVEQREESSQEDSDSPGHYSDDGSDWVDYVDCLGRTRRCLKEDIEEVRKQDEELASRLGVEGKEGPGTGGTEGSELGSSEPPPGPPSDLELLSNDMQREIFRQKWEEQEQELANKKNIYYEDVRFDEARSHGVAYYQFSTDERKREQQQAEFRKVREDTESKQKEAEEARLRRELAKQTRLMAARQRQRQRLGLPPIEVPPEEQGSSTEGEKTAEDTKEKEEEVSRAKLEEDLKRAAHVRPWDLGKEGMPHSDKVMSQEEWIEKKREERPEEFAPPVSPERRAQKKRPKKESKRKEKKAKRRMEVEMEKMREDVAGESDEEIGPPVPDLSVPPPPLGTFPAPPTTLPRDSYPPSVSSLPPPLGPVSLPAPQFPMPSPHTVPPPLPVPPPTTQLVPPPCPPPVPPPSTLSSGVPSHTPISFSFRRRLAPTVSVSGPTATPMAAPTTTPMATPSASTSAPSTSVASQRGAEIPPPLSFSYHTPFARRPPPVSSHSASEMMDSIEAGLNYLRQQTEKREKIISKKKF